MQPAASRIFDFLNGHGRFLADRHEVSDRSFAILRQSLRSIVVNLGDNASPEAIEICNGARVLLSEYLTVPAPFNESILFRIRAIGEPTDIGAQWGNEIRKAVERAQAAATRLQTAANPLREKLGHLIAELRESQARFRIFCHRSAVSHFRSLMNGESSLRPDLFLHTVRDYRRAEPFDALIKVGPLRSRGWGACPDAVITSPRFERLIQIVWSGCSDEDGFGYDPVTTAFQASSDSPGIETGRRQDWEWRINKPAASETDWTQADIELDDLEILRSYRTAGDTRSATLVQIDDEHGILYPAESKVQSLAPSGDEGGALADRRPGETLVEGMYIVMPNLADADLGPLHAEDGYFSRIWKKKLREQHDEDAEGLRRRLRGAGIELKTLENAIRHWCRPPSTVIHAPQQKKHFEALIKVLGIESETASRTTPTQWWRQAWREIAHARGEAIQEGMQEQDILDDQLKCILVEMLPEIRRQAHAAKTFQMDIPEGKPLQGRVKFLRIISIEEGFRVPQGMLKVVSELNVVEQWRS